MSELSSEQLNYRGKTIYYSSFRWLTMESLILVDIFDIDRVIGGPFESGKKR